MAIRRSRCEGAARGNLKSSLALPCTPCGAGLCSGQGFGSPAMTISKSGFQHNNFIDKFENYVIKFRFNNIFTTYPGSRRPRRLAVDECVPTFVGRCRPTGASSMVPRALLVGLRMLPKGTRERGKQ